MNSTIDFVLAYSETAEQQSLLRQLDKNPLVYTIVLVSTDGLHEYLSTKVVNLTSDELQSSKLLLQISAHLHSEWCACFLSSHYLELGYRCLERMLQVSDTEQTSMVYCDRFDADGKHPVIDWTDGALRDDFDFGSLWMFRSSLLKTYVEENLCHYRFAGIYAFRLYLSRKGSILHLPEFLYTEYESDLRQSGVKQFDYVSHSRKNVQKEMERACTEHLRQIGACLFPDEYENLPQDDAAYPVDVSVVIPVRNRVLTIADAVESALSQKTHFLFNVIVVDNHSDDGTSQVLEKCAKSDSRVVVIIPKRTDLGIGGCWDLAVRHEACGRYVVQLDSDDLYSSANVLERIVSIFEEENSAMVIGAYRMVDFDLQTLPPGLIDHNEWTNENGRNNALRVNGLGAPRAFRTNIIRKLGFPNTSYGEDYALGLRISRSYPISRIYDELYLCRRWNGNSDSNLNICQLNSNNAYKDRVRTLELHARQRLIERWNRPVDERDIDEFFDRQLGNWSEVQQRYVDLRENVQIRQLPLQVCSLSVQHNPMRIVSTSAKVDKLSLESRPCFLCDENRPSVQDEWPVLGRYQILVNPFPIIPGHITITARRHQPQNFSCFSEVMDQLVWNMPNHIVFYNGANCGASAPDHAHLQAGARGFVPIERDWKIYENHLKRVYPSTYEEETELEEMGYSSQNAGIFLLKNYACPAFVIRGIKADVGPFLMKKLLSVIPLENGGAEPDFNLLAWRQNKGNAALSDHIVYVVFVRAKHRPDCYYETGDKCCWVSPGALDMGGLLVTPKKYDFERMTSDRACSILREVSLNDQDMDKIARKLHAQSKGGIGRKPNAHGSCLQSIKNEPHVCVGLLSRNELKFKLNDSFEAKGRIVTGEQQVSFSEGAILWNDNAYSELLFVPKADGARFTLLGVTIGKNFHWQREQDQVFHGRLRFVVDEGQLVAINEVKVETYLESVISSEMSASSSLELLKAHAVVSRSWLLSQMFRRKSHLRNEAQAFFPFVRKSDELIRWYDREDHSLFDVCADDHCQRYQGVTSSVLSNVQKAIRETRGEVLLYDGKLCDARFSKCCGGITERYSACWEQVDYPYLAPVRDASSDNEIPDLTDEEEARKWILSQPKSYCNTSDVMLLNQVLNTYDRETQDFFRWRVEYTQKELKTLLREKLGVDFGEILNMQPLERAASGRLVKLRIVGTKRSLTIGKELEIRRALSPTHLYSSAIVVDLEDTNEEGIPQKFIFHGAGWGHGVGLCQIGAAVMANNGASYLDVLHHYYSNVTIEKLYK